MFVFFFSHFFFLFSVEGSYILVKSAVLLDLEFQHGISFLIWALPISLPLFLMLHLPFSLSPEIQPCCTACNSPKLIPLCYCISSYFFLGSSRIRAASFEWENSELQGWVGWHCSPSTIFLLCDRLYASLSQLWTVNSLREITMSYPSFFP